MPLLSSDPMFEDQSTRTLDHAIHGGADFGAYIATALDYDTAGRLELIGCPTFIAFELEETLSIEWRP